MKKQLAKIYWHVIDFNHNPPDQYLTAAEILKMHPKKNPKKSLGKEEK